jgi:anti-sigma regulatory factor (Ser/Thr protein kinase)
MAQTLDLAFDSGTLPALRAAVQVYSCQAGLPEDRAIDVVLVVHELAANAIRHGAGSGRVRMWSLPDALCYEVEDGGTAAQEYQEYQEEDDARADPWPYLEGHGLWVARKVADRLNVLSGTHGTRASVTFALPGGPVTPSAQPGLAGHAAGITGTKVTVRPRIQAVRG